MILVVSFSILAVFDLVTRDAVLAPVLWLLIVAALVWQGIEEQGSFRQFVVSVMAVFAGREYIEISPFNVQSRTITVGTQICALRSIQWSLPFDKVVSVQWNTGQATGMAGRDMNDWHLSLWYKDDSTKRKSRKPGQYVHVIGPSRRKEDTEAFGLAFVDFLRRAGLPLIRGEGDARFVRCETSH